MDKRSKFDFSHEYSMSFEIAMSLFFGNKADQLASLARNEEIVKKWLRNTIKKMVRDVNKLDTTTRHRDMLLMDLESVDTLLKNNGNLWEIIYKFIELSGRFLGYDYTKGIKLVTPYYCQTQNQDFWTQIYGGKDWKDRKKKQSRIIKRRLKIIEMLRKEGYTTFEISIILDTTEYQIKKTIKENKLYIKKRRWPDNV